MKIERFEDIKAWQEAGTLVKMVYEAVKSNKGFGTDYKFLKTQQTQRTQQTHIEEKLPDFLEAKFQRRDDYRQNYRSRITK